MNDLDLLMQKTCQTSKKWGYLTILFGIMAIALPMIIGVAVTMVFAIVLIIAGFVQIVATIPGEGRGVRLLLAYSTLIAGIIILLMPKFGLATLTLFLAAYFLVDALANFTAAWKLVPHSTWKHIALGGVSSLVMAVIILWQWPVSSDFVIGILIGVKLISLGTVFLTLGKSAENHSREKVIK